MRWSARRRAGIAVGSVLVALVLAGVLITVVLIRARSTTPVAAGQVPASAVAAAADVVSGTDDRARAALSPNLSGQVPNAAAIAPSGSALVLDPDSWGQYGAYASAIGQLTLPGQDPHRVLVGFVLVGGAWRVTAVEATP